MKSFIIINIYFLISINIILLFAIYYQTIKDEVKNKWYEKVISNLKPKVLDYIENEYKGAKLKEILKKDFCKNKAIDIMLDYSEKNDLDINKKFTDLDLDSFIIKKIQKKVSIVYVRKLAFMKVETAYNRLLETSSSQDLDISYMSFIGLSMMNISLQKKIIVIRKLLFSNIHSDRIIEILNKFELSFGQWLELLEEEESAEGKVVFIKNINQKQEIKIEENCDRLLKFLKDEKEIKIATILAISNSKNEKYIDELISIYENNKNWEVRVAVAKGLSNFNFQNVHETLLKMTRDKEWWIRFNAVKSIISMGEEGIFALIDLSLESEDKNISELAYSFLSSNKDVYNIVNKIIKNNEV
ncbi:HEAT repeat domain-containing protein [Clostridium vincentii]|nr:HEAT repeat domain-containing protein [Clostridium vincentii]